MFIFMQYLNNTMDMKNDISQEIADKIIHILLLKNDEKIDLYLTKIYDKFDIDIIIEKVLINLFNYPAYSEQYNTILSGIRKIFTNYLTLSAIILIKLEELLESQYNTIELLIIDYQINDTSPNRRLNHKMNILILKRIGEIYHNFPITKKIQTVIHIGNHDSELQKIYNVNDSFTQFIIRHIVYTSHSYHISRMIRGSTDSELLKIINWLDEPYCEYNARQYIKDCNNTTKLLNGIELYSLQNIKQLRYKHLHECLLHLINFDDLMFLCLNRKIFKSIKFFERYCCRVMECEPSINGIPDLRVYKRIKNALKSLTKISIAKQMQTLGAYDDPDNLNDRHLINLILMFI